MTIEIEGDEEEDHAQDFVNDLADATEALAHSDPAGVVGELSCPAAVPTEVQWPGRAATEEAAAGAG